MREILCRASIHQHVQTSQEACSAPVETVGCVIGRNVAMFVTDEKELIGFEPNFAIFTRQASLFRMAVHHTFSTLSRHTISSLLVAQALNTLYLRTGYSRCQHLLIAKKAAAACDGETGEHDVLLCAEIVHRSHGSARCDTVVLTLLVRIGW